jgi:hypothetical protein
VEHEFVALDGVTEVVDQRQPRRAVMITLGIFPPLRDADCLGRYTDVPHHLSGLRAPERRP